VVLACASIAQNGVRAQGTDLRVNDPAQDVGGVTQQETTIAVLEGPVTGSSDDILCIGFRDFANNARINGYARSMDGGASFQDLGSLSVSGGTPVPFADPTLVYSSSGGFYFGSLSLGLSGVQVHRGGTDCSFVFEGHVLSGGPSYSVDKPMFAVDQATGRVYAAYRGNPDVEVKFSDDPRAEPDSAWTQSAAVLGGGNGAWPAVSSTTGEVFVAFSWPGIKFFQRSASGSWTQRTPITTSANFWGDSAAFEGCNRPALNGFIRSEPLPQIAVQQVGGSEVIHAVWQADPDGQDPLGPDDSDVFYSRSLDGGVTWLTPARRLNDDQTPRDQWNPALAAGANGAVAVSWYDRRLDPANWWFDRYVVVSDDGGLTWGTNIRLSDVSSPVARMKPHVDFVGNSCDHGDYDQLAIASGVVHVIWSDARLPDPPPPPCSSGSAGAFYDTTCPNPDIYYDRVVLTDSDGDGRLDVVDNCPSDPDPTLADFDMDGLGDACDSCETIADAGSDADADGVDDACDTCRNQANPIIDANADGVPDAPTTNRTLVSHQRDDDGDGRGNRCDFDYNNAGLAITSSDFNDMKFSLLPGAGLVTQSSCGATVGNPPAGEGGSGADQRCGEFDHDGVGVAVAPADFELAAAANLAGGLIDSNFPRCSACTQGTGWSDVLGPGARLGRPVCQSSVAGACSYAP
jgi:hypothetical protein